MIMVDDVKVNSDTVVDLVRGSNLVGSKVQGLGVPEPRALCIRRGLRVDICSYFFACVSSGERWLFTTTPLVVTPQCNNSTCKAYRNSHHMDGGLRGWMWGHRCI